MYELQTPCNIILERGPPQSDHVTLSSTIATLITKRNKEIENLNLLARSQYLLQSKIYV